MVFLALMIFCLSTDDRVNSYNNNIFDLLLFKSSSKEKLFFALVIGGAAGNLFDRLIYFSVPDFIDLHYRGFHWFTFNIADIFITIGIICILFYEIFKKA